MTSLDFVYWLNGALELMDPKQLNETQIKIIKDHISLVLTKVTPATITLPGTGGQPMIPPPFTVTCDHKNPLLDLPMCSSITDIAGPGTKECSISDSVGSTLIRRIPGSGLVTC